MTKNEIVALLAAQPEGPVAPAVAGQVIEYMIANWERLGGKVDHSATYARKVSRAEDMMLTHPATVHFALERHGGIVCGSIYAELHRWNVDLLNETATYGEEGGRRRLYRCDESLKVGPIAADLVTAILAHDTSCASLKWRSEDDVQIKPATVIPTTNQQTTSGRRRRLCRKLNELLAPHGWMEIGSYRYGRQH